MRRFSALLLACTMGLSLCGTAGAAEGAQTLGADLPASDSGLSAYLQGEVLVQYDDGTFDVLSYESGADLSDGLEALSSDKGVVLVQPNYTYRSTVLSTDDALSGEQWALSNDGTFQMEEQQNEYPVYEDPFADPAGPGQWTPPQYWGIPGGLPGLFWGWSAASAASDAQVTAKAGIDINAEDAWSVYDGGSRDVGVVVRGAAELVRFDSAGTRTILERMETGGIFGELLAFTAELGDSLEVIAAGECEVLFMDYAHIMKRCEKACRHHSLLVENLFRLMAEQARRLSRRVSLLGQEDRKLGKRQGIPDNFGN